MKPSFHLPTVIALSTLTLLSTGSLKASPRSDEFTLSSWYGTKESSRTSQMNPLNVEANNTDQLTMRWNGPGSPSHVWISGLASPSSLVFSHTVNKTGTLRWSPPSSILSAPWATRDIQVSLYRRFGTRDTEQKAYVRVVPGLPSIPVRLEQISPGLMGVKLNATVGVPFSYTPPRGPKSYPPELGPFSMGYPWRNVPPPPRAPFERAWETTPWLQVQDVLGNTHQTELVSRTGRVTGTPTTPGTYTFTIISRNAGHQQAYRFFITVRAQGPSSKSVPASATDLLRKK